MNKVSIVKIFADDGIPFETEEACLEYEKNKKRAFEIAAEKERIQKIVNEMPVISNYHHPIPQTSDYENFFWYDVSSTENIHILNEFYQNCGEEGASKFSIPETLAIPQWVLIWNSGDYVEYKGTFEEYLHSVQDFARLFGYNVSWEKTKN